MKPPAVPPDFVVVMCDYEPCEIFFAVHRNELRLALGAPCPGCAKGKIIRAADLG